MSVAELIHFDKKGEVVPDSLFRRLFLSLVILLVGTLGFAVGRLTGAGKSEPVRIEFDQSLSAQTPTTSTNTASAIVALPIGGVVASAKGTKYHYPYCAGAKQISEANKITFSSASAAEAAGYTLASNCKPK
jgi:hypothetical protein